MKCRGCGVETRHRTGRCKPCRVKFIKEFMSSMERTWGSDTDNYINPKCLLSITNETGD